MQHDALSESDQRLFRTLESVTPEDLATPSLLPDWTRGHVVAHLALNAEALAGVLEGVLADEPRAMYASADARSQDIEDLSTAAAPDLLERLQDATSALHEAAARLTPEQEDTGIERTPGSGVSFKARRVLLMRWREVEIHHADLGLDYSSSDWPAAFAMEVLDGMRKRESWSTDFVAHATDLDSSWRFGSPDADSPTVAGPSTSLAWWSTGRGAGSDLSSSTGQLPEIEGW